MTRYMLDGAGPDGLPLPGALETALMERQAAFLVGDDAEEWVLPLGEHVIGAALTLGADDRELAIVGQGDTRLRFDAGGLALRGAWVRVTSLALDAAAAGDGAALAVDAGVAELERVRVRAAGGDVVGLRALARDEALLADCTASDIVGTTRASGIEVVAPALEVTRLAVRALSAPACVGLTLVSPEGGRLLALDLTVEQLTASAGVCQGLSIYAAGPLRARGLTLREFGGRSVFGATVLGAAEIEVASGRVHSLRGDGAGAVGLRVLGATVDASVSVHDIAVEAIGGVNPRSDARPLEALAAWATEMAQALRSPAVSLEGLPPFPSADAESEVVGVHVGAGLDAYGWAQVLEPSAVELEDVIVWRVAGTALQVEAGLRSAELRRIELWAAARAGWLQAENLLLAEATVHRHLAPLRFGPGNVRVLNALFSGTEAGATPVLEAEAELVELRAAFAVGSAAPWRALDAEPYVDAGPAPLAPETATGVVPPDAPVDLSVADPVLHAAAEAVDGDDAVPFVGAREPELPAPCRLDDPEPRLWRAPEPEYPADAVANYRARDASTLLALMSERARVSMLPWTDGDPSDLTQMLFELLAERLDHLAYEQERAVAEGFLDRARLRRSVEDHARPLDYRPDPGLSASVMVRFEIDRAALVRAAEEAGGAALDLGLSTPDAHPIEIAAGTLVGNDRPEERSITFATESLLSYLPELERVRLAESVAVGETSARLIGRFERLERGRWLVLSRGPHFPGLALRVTEIELETDTTRIAWDPRRPAEHPYPATAPDDSFALVFGNVVPAQHGLPLERRGPSDAPDALDLALDRWRALLERRVDGASTRELELPLSPSIHAGGYPFPSEIRDELRNGRRALTVAVDGDVWSEVEDLASYGPDDEVYVVRAGSRGLPMLRFGDGTNGQALPARSVTIELEMTVGGGASGNIGAFTLNQLLRFGRGLAIGTDPEALIVVDSGPLQEDLLRSIWKVTNPLPAVGGRDPEPLETIRYRAPLGVRQALSAVAPRDYENLLLALPFVAGARARVVEAGVVHGIQVTVLLRDEDTLPEAELLRRWALVRRRLEEIRLLGFDVEAVPPIWVPLDLDLSIEAAAHAEPGRLRADITEAIAGNGGLLDPDTTGLGGDLRLSDLYQAVQRVPGVRSVRVKRFRRLEAGARERLADGVIPVADHEVATVGGPRHPGLGLLTLGIAGGLA